MSSAINHLWSILSESVSVDQTTNILSLFNTVEEINVFQAQIAGLPTENGLTTIPTRLVLSTLWKNDALNQAPEEQEVKITLHSPDNKKLQEIGYKFRFQNGKPRMRAMINIPALTIEKKTGEYTLVIELREVNNGKYYRVGQIPLQITLI